MCGGELRRWEAFRRREESVGIEGGRFNPQRSYLVNRFMECQWQGTRKNTL